MLTDSEQVLLDVAEKPGRYHQVVSRIRLKITEKLAEEVRLLEEKHPELPRRVERGRV